MTQDTKLAPEDNEKQSPAALIGFISIIVIVVIAFFFMFNRDSEQPLVNATELVESVPNVIEPIVEAVEPEVIIETPEPEPEVIEEVEVELPALNDSDSYIKANIEQLSWRKELLDLILTDDVVRRIVVVTDNFVQGEMAYSHLPLKPLDGRFNAKEVADSADANDGQADTRLNQQQVFEFDQTNFTRYQPYLELLHSFEPELLVQNFITSMPLFEEAYQELGYPDRKFIDVVLQATDQILDFPVQVEQPKLIQPSVVYVYQQQSLEELPAADKFLLRLGKDNLLQLKAFALELDNQLKSQLAQQ